MNVKTRNIQETLQRYFHHNLLERLVSRNHVYRKKAKVLFQVTMEAVVHNFKRLIQIESEPLVIE